MQRDLPKRIAIKGLFSMIPEPKLRGTRRARNWPVEESSCGSAGNGHSLAIHAIQRNSLPEPAMAESFHSCIASQKLPASSATGTDKHQ